MNEFKLVVRDRESGEESELSFASRAERLNAKPFLECHGYAVVRFVDPDDSFYMEAGGPFPIDDSKTEEVQP